MSIRRFATILCLHYAPAVLLVLFTVGIQLWRITEPYVLAYETGFQELIARRHLDPGISVTKALSTINNLGPEPNWHPAHPPLLQLTLSLLYAALGDHEAVARLIPLLSLIAILFGLWRVSGWYLSNSGQLAVLAAAAVMPLSAYVGRVVNFESPTLACIVLTMMLVEEIHYKSRSWTVSALYIIAVAGSLMDWPYQIFMTSMAFLTCFRTDTNPEKRWLVYRIWLISLGVSIFYLLTLVGVGAYEIPFRHILTQSGSYVPRQGFQWPLYLTEWRWWWKLIINLNYSGTPILFISGLIWLGWTVYTKPILQGMHFWNLTCFLFVAVYFGLLSRAADNHFWFYFYVLPFFSLAFGWLIQQGKMPWIVLCFILLITSSISLTIQYRQASPFLPAVQLGKIIDQADDCLPREKHLPMNGPLLYTSRGAVGSDKGRLPWSA